MGRKRSTSHCIVGKPLGQWTGHSLMLAPSDCTACGDGPLHATWKGGGSYCTCSFQRAGVLVCRQCAIAFDVVTKGYSRIDHPTYSMDAMQETVAILQRGLSVQAVSKQ